MKAKAIAAPPATSLKLDARETESSSTAQDQALLNTNTKAESKFWLSEFKKIDTIQAKLLLCLFQSCAHVHTHVKHQPTIDGQIQFDRERDSLIQKALAHKKLFLYKYTHLIKLQIAEKQFGRIGPIIDLAPSKGIIASDSIADEQGLDDEFKIRVILHALVPLLLQSLLNDMKRNMESGWMLLILKLTV